MPRSATQCHAVISLPVVRHCPVDPDLDASEEVDAESRNRIGLIFRPHVLGDVLLPVELVPLQAWNYRITFFSFYGVESEEPWSSG